MRLFETKLFFYLVQQSLDGSSWQCLKIDKAKGGVGVDQGNVKELGSTSMPFVGEIPSHQNSNNNPFSAGFKVEIENNSLDTSSLGEFRDFIIDDKVIYTEQQIADLLEMIAHGNKNNGGLKLVIKDFHGIFGFARFTEGYYMILITAFSRVSLLGGHEIRHIDETIMIQVGGAIGGFTNLNASFSGNFLEQRYLQIFSQVDTTKNFYYSPTYDLANTLQSNLALSSQHSKRQNGSMFVWNTWLLEGYLLKESKWYQPIIHGFVDQSKISVYGHNVYVTLIARRSRHFAGARFLKRGVSDQGYVANDVETEQIVNDASTTMFTLPINKCGKPNPGFTSFVQHRGSVPLYWSQENTAMAAKPLIQLNAVDPFYTAAALHFSNLFSRYGTPITILNLVKSKEKTKRESILLVEFGSCVRYLNQFLEGDKKMRYIAWDMARASKSNVGEDVVSFLEKIGKRIVGEKGIFHSKVGVDGKQNFQQGVLRTNCIDCLDRTNAAQFLVGKQALAHQLWVIGVISRPEEFDFDSEACDMFNAMYHDHGDTIALQYGGSHLVNTMETYRRVRGGGDVGGPGDTNGGAKGGNDSGISWTSHSRDMIESIKRYYSNSFTDAEKQDAINLFLGNYVPSREELKVTRDELWELPTDFYLHNQHPMRQSPAKSYTKWFNFSEPPFKSLEHLEGCPLITDQDSTTLLFQKVVDDFKMFSLYYDVTHYTPLDHFYAFGIISTNPTIASFQSRVAARKTPIIYNLNIGGVRQWLKPLNIMGSEVEIASSKLKEAKTEGKKKSNISGQIVSLALSDYKVGESVQPSVNEKEREEYRSYIAQFELAPLWKNSSKASEIDLVEPMSMDPSLSPEYLIYFEYLSKKSSSLSSASQKEQTEPVFVVDAKSRAAYFGFVNEQGSVDSYLGPLHLDIARYESYVSYISFLKLDINKSLQ